MWQAALVTSLALGGGCYKHLEMTIVQDASGSFYDMISAFGDAALTLFEGLTETVGPTRIATVPFVDKPAPGQGRTNGFGCYTDEIEDYCYDNSEVKKHGMTSDMSEFESQITFEFDNGGSGGDFPEDPIEAAIFAAIDPSIGWTPPGAETDAPIARILLIVTDDLLKVANASSDFTERWRDLYYDEYFADEFATVLINGDGQCTTAHDRATELHAKVEDGSITPDELEELNKLYAFIGPPDLPKPLPFEVNLDNAAKCGAYEYPSPQQFIDTLAEREIIPVFAFTQSMYGTATTNKCTDAGLAPDDGNWTLDAFVHCMQVLYQGALGLDNFYSIGFDVSDTQSFIDNVIQIVEEVSEQLCSTSSTDEETTTSGAPLTTTTTTKHSTKSETQSSTSTRSTTTSSEAHSSTSTSAAHSTTSHSTTTENGTTRSGTTKTGTTSAAIDSTSESAVPDDRDRQPVVIGTAVAGAAAGLGVITAGLYAVFSKRAADPGTLGDVSQPETYHDRETIDIVSHEIYE